MVNQCSLKRLRSEAGGADSAFVNPVRGKAAIADNGLFTVRAAFSA
jgi:hypothetical protein